MPRQNDKQNGANKTNDVMDYQSSGDEKYLNMDHSVDFAVKKNYDYLLDRGIKRILTSVFRAIIWFLLEIIDRGIFGIKINGKENLKSLSNSGAVIVCNHVHPMDCTFLVLPTYPKRQYYLTLESNFQIPFIGKLIRVLLAVPISENPFRMKEMFGAMNEAVKKGYYVVVFPEGELVPYCKQIREFKPGSFRIAVKSGVPTLPCVITYRRPKGLRRLFSHKPLCTLNILPPILPPTDGSVKQRTAALENECRYRMETFIKE